MRRTPTDAAIGLQPSSRRHDRRAAVTSGHPDGGLLPNARLIARREYVEKIRSRAFAVATAILMAVATGAALVPIGLRALDRGQTTTIGVASADPAVTARVLTLVSEYLNPIPPGADPATIRPHYLLSAEPDLATGLAAVRGGHLDSLLEVTIQPGGGLDFTFHGNDGPTSATIQRLQVATFGAAVVEYSQDLQGSAGPPFHLPGFELQPTDAGAGVAAIDPAVTGSRTLLASILVVLIFITLTVYGMWVATSVASEKASRVMELLISAGTPRQLLVGKVIGVGAAGLTQYLAILLPATLVLALQDPIATALIGPADPGEAPLVGLTLPILLAFGAFFILGFLLYAFVYAAAGSLVSRPEDIQQLAMPLSFVSMAGYFAAIFGMTAINSRLIEVLSFVPFFSPYVMLARVMLGHVEAWEVALSLALLVASIAASSWVAARIYGAGVLLYGQRPGFRTFLRVAIRPGGD
jgi:ABC-2 type transport system permease protein